MATTSVTESAIITELASQLIDQIGSFFERITPTSSLQISEFPDDDEARNFLYVLYSASGMPLGSGVVMCHASLFRL